MVQWALSVDIVQYPELPRLSTLCLWTLSTDTLDKVKADWTMSYKSMDSLDIVHGQSPLFVLAELVTLELE